MKWQLRPSLLTSRNRALPIPPNLPCDFLILAPSRSQRQLLSSILFLVVFPKKQASLNALLVLPALELYINAIKNGHICIRLFSSSVRLSRLIQFAPSLHPLEPVVWSHPLFIYPFHSCWMRYFQFGAVVTWCWYVLVSVSRNTCATHSFWIYTQKWNCWAIRVCLCSNTVDRAKQVSETVVQLYFPSASEERSILCIRTDNTSPGISV